MNHALAYVIVVPRHPSRKKSTGDLVERLKPVMAISHYNPHFTWKKLRHREIQSHKMCS